MDTTYDIAIVGAGASGLVAAIAAATPNGAQSKAASVVVFEQQERVGKPILLTGNGRCNFSNEQIADGATQRFRNSLFVDQALEALQQMGNDVVRDPVLNFFEDIGLEWREEGDGRRYPLANKASVVVDVLRAQAAHLGVVEACNMQVVAVDIPAEDGGVFTLKMANGELFRARAVVLAGGCRAVNALLPGGIAHTEAEAVLGPLQVAEADRAFCTELDNIRVKCCVQLFRASRSGAAEDELLASEIGELLFRKYGVSGICIYDLSRYAQPGDRLQIDFFRLGDISFCRESVEFRTKLLSRDGTAPSYERYLRGLVLPRVADALMKRAGVLADSPVAEEVLLQMLCNCSLTVAGVGSADLCQVWRGGVDVAEVDPATMGLGQVKGLYVAGEGIDVDGPCGGYNLHWAWASGLLAGYAAAQFVQSPN